MAGKRSGKASKPKQDNLAKPSKWRLQHGGFSEAQRDADPESGTPVAHHRAVDTLGLMFSHGTISAEMHDAGTKFRTLFRTAALGGVQISSMVRISGASGDGLMEHHLAARKRVSDAVLALGGFDSVAGSIVWHVVGLETSVREWAMRQGWGGRSVSPPHAQGMLVAALSTLAGHYGLLRRQHAA